MPFALLLALLSQRLDAALQPALQTGPAAKTHDAATASDTPISIDLSLDANRGGSARWIGVTPSVTYVATGRWSFEAGLPVFAVNGALSEDAASHVGLGDAYLTVYLDFSGEETTCRTSGTVNLPTGRVREGLGFGQVTWQWSNHIERTFGRVTPYADGGLSDGLDLASRVNRVRPGLRGAPPAPVLGRIIDAEGGATVDLTDAVSLSASGYLAEPWGTQSIVTTMGPKGNRTVVVSTANLIRDRGWSASLYVSTGRMADVSLWYWRSNTFHSDTVSASLVLHLWEMWHRTP